MEQSVFLGNKLRRLTSAFQSSRTLKKWYLPWHPSELLKTFIMVANNFISFSTGHSSHLEKDRIQESKSQQERAAQCCGQDAGPGSNCKARVSVLKLLGSTRGPGREWSNAAAFQKLQPHPHRADIKEGTYCTLEPTLLLVCVALPHK